MKHDGALLKTISGRCHLLAFDGMQAATATYAARLVDSTFGSERESRRTSRCKVLIFSGCEPLPPTPVALSAALTQLRLDDIVLYSATDASVSAFVRAKVRPTPSWPRSWANSSLFPRCSHSRDAWADLRFLGQPNTFPAEGRHARRGGPAGPCSEGVHAEDAPDHLGAAG